MNPSLMVETQQEVSIRQAQAGPDAQLWEHFVSRNSHCNSAHRWNWKGVFEESFGWRTFYLMAEEEGSIRGILPLVWQKNWPLTAVLSSVPHLKGGGIVAETPEIEARLLAEARRLAKELQASTLELRHNSSQAQAETARTDKVAFVLPLLKDEKERLQALDKKTRNMVKKSLSFGLTAEFNQERALDDFYEIFCCNMRELGSPVYARGFFQAIRRAFPESTHICVVRHQGKAIAAAFLHGFRHSVEAIWASSLSQYRALKPNMFMYWNLFRFAAERGYDEFDFGRSSVGSGTYNFKMQWSAKPVPLYWNYWLGQGSGVPQVNGHSAKVRLVRWTWQRLPLSLTKVLGPQLIKFVPGV